MSLRGWFGEESLTRKFCCFFILIIFVIIFVILLARQSWAVGPNELFLQPSPFLLLAFFCHLAFLISCIISGVIIIIVIIVIVNKLINTKIINKIIVIPNTILIQVFAFCALIKPLVPVQSHNHRKCEILQNPANFQLGRLLLSKQVSPSRK